MIFTDRIMYRPAGRNLLDHTQQDRTLMNSHQCQKKETKENGISILPNKILFHKIAMSNKILFHEIAM